MMMMLLLLLFLCVGRVFLYGSADFRGLGETKLTDLKLEGGFDKPEMPDSSSRFRFSQIKAK